MIASRKDSRRPGLEVRRYLKTRFGLVLDLVERNAIGEFDVMR